MILDLTDPAVLEMARQDHIPEETWTAQGASGARHLTSVSCTMCGWVYPCPTVNAIRRRDEEQQERWRKEKAEAVRAEVAATESLEDLDTLDFRTSLARLLNRFNYDGRLRTMDWMIADHLLCVLDSLSMMLIQRDTKQTGILDPQRQLREDGVQL